MLCVFVRAAKNTTIAWLSGIEKLATYGLRRLCVETQTLIIDFCVVLIATDAFVDLIWSGFLSRDYCKSKSRGDWLGSEKLDDEGFQASIAVVTFYVLQVG